MILCERAELLFLELPKNASTTIAKILIDGLDGVRVYSPPLEGAPTWSNGLATHRYTRGDEIPEGVTVFACLRDPLTRAMSMWDHFVCRHRQVFGFPEWRFQEFAYWLAMAHPDYSYPKCEQSDWHREQALAFRSQADALLGVHVDCFVRTEHLAEDLGRVGISRDAAAMAGRLNRGGRERNPPAGSAARAFVDRWATGDYHLRRLADEGRGYRPIV